MCLCELMCCCTREQFFPLGSCPLSTLAAFDCPRKTLLGMRCRFSWAPSTRWSAWSTSWLARCRRRSPRSRSRCHRGAGRASSPPAGCHKASKTRPSSQAASSSPPPPLPPPPRPPPQSAIPQNAMAARGLAKRRGAPLSPRPRAAGHQRLSAARMVRLRLLEFAPPRVSSREERRHSGGAARRRQEGVAFRRRLWPHPLVSPGPLPWSPAPLPRVGDARGLVLRRRLPRPFARRKSPPALLCCRENECVSERGPKDSRAHVAAVQVIELSGSLRRQVSSPGGHVVHHHDAVRSLFAEPATSLGLNGSVWLADLVS